MIIRFEEDDREYYFDSKEAEHNYEGDNPALAVTLDNIEGGAQTIISHESEDDMAQSTKRERQYSPQKARDMIVSILKTEEGFSIIDEGKSVDKSSQPPQIVEGPLSNDVQVYNTNILYKDIPNEANHIGPNDEVPEGYITFEGPRGGTYAISPQDAAQYADGDVTAEDIIEEFGEEDTDSPEDSQDATVESEIASDKISPEDREIPDGVSGPIENWNPDDVDEPVISPNMRFAEIGSDAHPLFWSRPEPDEMDSFVEGVRQDEEWSKGQDAFERGFFGDDNTADDYVGDDGNWDEERNQMHDEWTDELLNTDAVAEEGEQPVGMVVLGPPGAGKGWWQEQVEDGQYGDKLGDREFTHVNSDETKEPIPEYNGTNASYVHEEASKMASDDLAPKTINENHNVILDKVATTPDGMMETVSKMQEAGYDLRASFIDVPEEKAAHNAVSRFYQEGRFTPFEYILNGGPGEDDSARDGSKRSFETLIEEAGIPEEKIGRFNNDVQWGNAPDASQVGSELLKTLLEFYGVELANKYMR